MDTSSVNSADQAPKPSEAPSTAAAPTTNLTTTASEAVSAAVSNQAESTVSTSSGQQNAPTTSGEPSNEAQQQTRPKRFHHGRRGPGRKNNERKYRRAMYEAGLPMNFGQSSGGHRHHPYYRPQQHAGNSGHHFHRPADLIERESGNNFVDNRERQVQAWAPNCQRQQRGGDHYHKQQYTRPPLYTPRDVMCQQENLNYSVVAVHDSSSQNQPHFSGHHRPRRTSEGEHGHHQQQQHHQRPYNSHAKGHYMRRKRKRMDVKRPADAPPAPNNSTQFIIDDLEQRAGPLDLDSDSGPEVTTEEFEEKDFEAAFNGARFEELMSLERTELVERYQSLETSVTDLQRQLHTTSNNGLEHQLAALREENQKLKRNNLRLRSELRAKSDESSASNQEDDGGLFAESTEPMPWGASPRHGMVTVGTSPRRPPSIAASPARPSQYAAVISSPHHSSRSPMDDSRSPIHAVHSPQLLCIG